MSDQISKAQTAFTDGLDAQFTMAVSANAKLAWNENPSANSGNCGSAFEPLRFLGPDTVSRWCATRRYQTHRSGVEHYRPATE